MIEYVTLQEYLRYLSQSLIHQVSVSDTLAMFQEIRSDMSQSLIHQVSVSDVADGHKYWVLTAVESQSLIHQVSVSDLTVM